MNFLNRDKDLKHFLKDVLYDAILFVDGVSKVKDIKGKLLKDKREVICDIYLCVDYNVVISDVAWKVQNVCKDILKSVEDINVKSINIHIIGVIER